MSTSRKPISVSFPEELLPDIDARAEALGQSRSGYIMLLVRNDLKKRGVVEIQPAAPPSSPRRPKGSK
jgi:metal-responsive CopG/Arc/MetJ family transcriptional regulator